MSRGPGICRFREYGVSAEAARSERKNSYGQVQAEIPALRPVAGRFVAYFGHMGVQVKGRQKCGKIRIWWQILEIGLSPLQAGRPKITIFGNGERQ